MTRFKDWRKIRLICPLCEKVTLRPDWDAAMGEMRCPKCGEWSNEDYVFAEDDPENEET